MNLITTLGLVIAIATSLTGVSAVSSLRGVADTFEDQVAVALGGHQKNVSGGTLSLSTNFVKRSDFRRLVRNKLPGMVGR